MGAATVGAAIFGLNWFPQSNHRSSNPAEKAEFTYGTLFQHTQGNMRNPGGYLFQFPDGKILATWLTGGSDLQPNSKSFLKALSTDDGLTWSRPEPVNLPHFPMGRFMQLRNGTVLNFYADYHPSTPAIVATSHIKVKVSKDYMNTWGPEIPVETGEPYSVISVDSPKQISNQDIILPWSYWNNSSRWNSSFMISRDNGETWFRGGTLSGGRSEGLDEPAVVELGDGTLYCLMRTNIGVQYESSSSDGALSWTTPKRSIFKSPSASAVMRKLNSGNIMVIWDNVSSENMFPRYPLAVALSDDDGRTWKYVRTVTSGTSGLLQGEYSNLDALQLQSGAILLLIPNASGYPSFEDMEYARFNEAWITSK
jgi:hypothetical protein